MLLKRSLSRVLSAGPVKCSYEKEISKLCYFLLANYYLLLQNESDFLIGYQSRKDSCFRVLSNSIEKLAQKTKTKIKEPNQIKMHVSFAKF